MFRVTEQNLLDQRRERRVRRLFGAMAVALIVPVLLILTILVQQLFT